LRGIYALATSKEPGPVNIGNPNEHSVLEFATIIQRMTQTKSKIVHKPLPVDDPKVRQPDITRAKKILGWEPRVSLEDGLDRTISWFSSILKPSCSCSHSKPCRSQKCC